jgi:hypothetical protein
MAQDGVWSLPPLCGGVVLLVFVLLPALYALLLAVFVVPLLLVPLNLQLHLSMKDAE